MTPEQKKGQDGTCPTVRVKAKNEQGYIVINESDFDPKVHQKCEDQGPPPEGEKDPKDMSKAELVKLLHSLGKKDASEKMKKDALLAMLD